MGKKKGALPTTNAGDATLHEGSRAEITGLSDATLNGNVLNC